ncbi:hypothetical protein ACEWY4_020064 [Coilia grayii]|uniref:DUF6729 domain-containing protein n=1 Tax=Coilia grayii TaxID=363190 RepID=A0ABD1JER5_9TELE
MAANSPGISTRADNHGGALSPGKCQLITPTPTEAQVLGQLVFTFGKYTGQTFKWLVQKDVGYCKYIIDRHMKEMRHPEKKKAINDEWLKEQFVRRALEAYTSVKQWLIMKEDDITSKSLKKFRKYILDKEQDEATPSAMSVSSKAPSSAAAVVAPTTATVSMAPQSPPPHPASSSTKAPTSAAVATALSTATKASATISKAPPSPPPRPASSSTTSKACPSATTTKAPSAEAAAASTTTPKAPSVPPTTTTTTKPKKKSKSAAPKPSPATPAPVPISSTAPSSSSSSSARPSATTASSAEFSWEDDAVFAETLSAYETQESQSQEAVGGEDVISFEGWHKSWEAEETGLPKQDIKWLKEDDDRGLFQQAQPFTDKYGRKRWRKVLRADKMWFNPPEMPGVVEGSSVPVADSFFRNRVFFWRPVGVWRYSVRCTKPDCPAKEDEKAFLYRCGYSSTVRPICDINGWYFMLTEVLACDACRKAAKVSQGHSISRYLSPWTKSGPWLRDSWPGTGEAYPELMYMDRGCCCVLGLTSLEQLLNEWADAGMLIRLDIFHWIHRHPARYDYLTDSEFIVIVSTYDLTHYVRRITVGAQETSVRVHSVIDALQDAAGIDENLGHRFKDAAAIDYVWQNQQKHLECTQDTPGCNMYTILKYVTRNGVYLAHYSMGVSKRRRAKGREAHGVGVYTGEPAPPGVAGAVWRGGGGNFRPPFLSSDERIGLEYLFAQ